MELNVPCSTLSYVTIVQSKPKFLLSFPGKVRDLYIRFATTPLLLSRASLVGRLYDRADQPEAVSHSFKPVPANIYGVPVIKL